MEETIRDKQLPTPARAQQLLGYKPNTRITTLQLKVKLRKAIVAAAEEIGAAPIAETLQDIGWDTFLAKIPAAAAKPKTNKTPNAKTRADIER